MSEHRKEDRTEVDVKVDYRTVGSFVTDYTANISKGGLFIHTSLPLQVGERVRLRLTLPNGDAPFALDGVVKWISKNEEGNEHPPGMGVEFVDFDEEIKAKLDALVDAHQRNEG